MQRSVNKVARLGEVAAQRRVRVDRRSSRLDGPMLTTLSLTLSRQRERGQESVGTLNSYLLREAGLLFFKVTHSCAQNSVSNARRQMVESCPGFRRIIAMLTVLKNSHSSSLGVSRRQLLQAGGAGLFGLNLTSVLAAEEATPFREARAKSVIFLFLFGGPSQLETFDMKPDAPIEIRGPFKPIKSRTPELRISEHLPGCAAISDKFAVIKTMSHSYNDHSGAGHYIQTGHRWKVPIGGGFNVTPNDWPSMGSVVKFFTQQTPERFSSDIPSYVVVPNFLGTTT